LVPETSDLRRLLVSNGKNSAMGFLSDQKPFSWLCTQVGSLQHGFSNPASSVKLFIQHLY
jgi:hypothetical protein